MGFLRPKMPPPPPPPPPSPAPPPATITEEFKDESGEMTTAEKKAEQKIAEKKKGYSSTILTSPQGVTDEANTYSKTLLGS